MISAQHSLSDSTNFENNPNTSTEPSNVKSHIAKNDMTELSLRSLTLSDTTDEPLLKPNPRRFVLFPIQFNEIWQAYKNLEANFWSAEEVEMSDDLNGFEQLSRKEQSLMLQITSILCMGCGLNNEAILSRYSDEIQIPEARCFFGFQLMQKNIHSELSMVILDMFSESEKQRDDLLDVIQQLPSRTMWTEWARTHMTRSEEPFALRVTSLAIFQAIHQVSLRDIIAFIAGPETSTLPVTSSESHLLHGVVHAMHKIHHDQLQYLSFLALIQSNLVRRADTQLVHLMARAAVAAEHTLIDDVFNLSTGNILLCGKIVPKEALKGRIEFLTDMCLTTMGYPAMYHVQDPIPWISVLHVREAKKGSADTHTTQTVVSAKPNMQEDHAFTVDEDF
ncbi:hypothetical protein O5D80_000777 [Batrachochytrium dendrobatidis]|nr:hypothetical protein O5D80_000777 [Batrachochytrium dendrobatidis]